MNGSTEIQLALNKGFAISQGPLIGSKSHRHTVMELFISLGEPIKIISDDRLYCGKSFLLGPHVPHSIQKTSDPAVLFIFDHTQIMANALQKQYLADSPIADLTRIVNKRGVLDLLQKKVQTSPLLPEKTVFDTVSRLLDSNMGTNTLDDRIQKALHYIGRQEMKKLPLSDIARHIYLSESRLAHLFKEQVGIPVRRYQLWLRLIDGISSLLQNKSFSDAAHQAGFSDYAHFSRTFRSMFGNSLSDVFRHKVNLKIHSAFS